MVSSQINDGKWTSRQLVTARLKENNADYSFSKDTVTIQTIINENGSVEGFCGGAKLKDCSISENRGWFGRLFNLYTDYIITGKLIGSVFEKDTLNLTIPCGLPQGKKYDRRLFYRDTLRLAAG